MRGGESKQERLAKTEIKLIAFIIAICNLSISKTKRFMFCYICGGFSV